MKHAHDDIVTWLVWFLKCKNDLCKDTSAAKRSHARTRLSARFAAQRCRSRLQLKAVLYWGASCARKSAAVISFSLALRGRRGAKSPFHLASFQGFALPSIGA